jgi:hypothetical protein
MEAGSPTCLRTLLERTARTFEVSADLADAHAARLERKCRAEDAARERDVAKRARAAARRARARADASSSSSRTHQPGV